MFRPSKKLVAFARHFFEKQSKIPTVRLVDNTFGKYEVIEPWPVSKIRTVPLYIPKPPYNAPPKVENSPNEPEIKNQNQVKSMRQSCTLAKRVLQEAGRLIKPGVTTDSLDESLHEIIISNCAYPSPLNYNGFPKSICTSINNIACHGIPDSRPLRDGDILNVDITVYQNGYHGDCSNMFIVGEADNEAKQLINTAALCLKNAIEICKPDENFCNIGNVIEETAAKYGFNVIPIFCGHGIGSYFHGPPDIYHVANNQPGKMKAGMTFTIEPVLSQGSWVVDILEDGWTTATIDDSRTAQVEHTVLITDYGCEVLTL